MDTRLADGKVSGECEPEPDPKPGPVPPPYPEEVSTEISAWMVALLAGLALLLAWGFTSMILGIQNFYGQSPLIGIPLAILGLAFGATLIWVFVREYRAFRQVDRLKAESKALSESLEQDDKRGVLDALAPRLTALRLAEPEIVAQFEAAARGSNHARRVHELFRNIVLSTLDEKAEKVIDREAMQTALAVAILPHPALDAAVVLWRSCGLVRKISTIYGVEATGLSSLRLLQHIIQSAMMAAAAESISEILVRESFAGTLGRFVKSLGEAAVTYARFRLLGNFAKEMLVPVVIPTGGRLFASP